MRVLIVCPCWPGIEEAYNNGKEPNGMPGFYYVVRELINRGDKVDLFIYTPRDVQFYKNMMPQDHWFSGVTIIQSLTLQKHNGLQRIIYELRLPFILNWHLFKLLKVTKYDFIYGQGNYADSARIAAKKYNISFGLRKYGDDFAPLLKEVGIVEASMRSPAAAISYLTKKDFILATNDGTEIDKICTRFKKKTPYDVYLWNNGFNDRIGEDDKFHELTQVPFVFQFSRIYRVKGQLDTIVAFHYARQNGFVGNLIIAGTPDDKAYYEEIKKKIQEFGLNDSVHFVGKITAEQTNYLTKRAVANVVSGVNYNLNNVLIESLGYGGVVVVRKTPLIETVIKHAYNGFVFSSIEECSDIILKLHQGTYDTESIRQNAVMTCKKTFSSWEERAKREADLITKYALQKD